MFKKSVAAREKVKLMVGLTGPSGSGKTLSALKLAHGVAGDWGKIALADTENKSALYYAGAKTGPWEHIEFNPDMSEGYHPRNWIKLIEFVEKDPNIEVLILDSISHEWEGKGGCLDLVDKLTKGSKSGNSYVQWKQVTPIHNAFIDKIRNSRLHVIATMRSKQEFVIDDSDGKKSIRKVGLKSTQREGVDYEFGIIFDVEMNHFATSSKDRTGLFADRGSFQINEATGKEILEWSNSGLEAPKAEDEPTGTDVYIGSPKQRIALMKLFEKCGVAKGSMKETALYIQDKNMTFAGAEEYLQGERTKK